MALGANLIFPSLGSTPSLGAFFSLNRWAMAVPLSITLIVSLYSGFRWASFHFVGQNHRQGAH